MTDDVPDRVAELMADHALMGMFILDARTALVELRRRMLAGDYVRRADTIALLERVVEQLTAALGAAQ